MSQTRSRVGTIRSGVSGDGDLYLIATLAPGETAASVEFAGRRFELDGLTPTTAWIVPADVPLVITGDAGRVVVTAVTGP